jgi:hypothetical protein
MTLAGLALKLIVTGCNILEKCVQVFSSQYLQFFLLPLSPSFEPRFGHHTIPINHPYKNSINIDERVAPIINMLQSSRPHTANRPRNQKIRSIFTTGKHHISLILIFYSALHVGELESAFDLVLVDRVTLVTYAEKKITWE